MEDLNKYNTSYMLSKVDKQDTFLIHVTQVIDLCPKDILYSNLIRVMNIPLSAGHIYSTLGTAVHTYISDTFRNDEKDLNSYFPEYYSERDKFNRSISNFKEWKKKRLTDVYEIYSEIGKTKEIGDNIILTGTSDLIVKEDDGYVVIDFKTSKTASMIKKYFLQLAGYKYMFKEFDIIRGEIVLLGGSKYKIYKTDLVDEQNDFMILLEQAKDTINKIRNKDIVKSKVSFRCAMCNFRGICNGSDIIPIQLSDYYNNDNERANTLSSSDMNKV